MTDPTGKGALPEAPLIRISGTEILPQGQQTIAVGDILRATVRSNNGGAGVLYMRGALISAAIPKELSTGERILTQVKRADDQLVLQLLQTEPTQAAESAGASAPATDALSATIQALLEQSITDAAFGRLGSAPALGQPQVGTALEGTDAKLAELLQRLVVNTDAQEPAQLATALKQSASALNAPALRALAAQFRLLAGERGDETTAGRAVSDLRRALNGLLEDALVGAKPPKPGIDLLLSNFGKELEQLRRLPAKERTVLERAERELRALQSAPEPVTGALGKAIERLSALLLPPATTDLALDAAKRRELLTFAERLDDLATAQQQLQQMNAVMQAIGEPALVLFPFLASGLLNHSELSFGADREPDGEDAGRAASDDESEDPVPFQRVQLSVPLPTLGTVAVDATFRPNEFYIRLALSDPDAASFVTASAETLVARLRELGYGTAEVRAHTSPLPTATPEWYRQLLRAAGFVA